MSIIRHARKSSNPHENATSILYVMRTPKTNAKAKPFT